MSGYGERKSRAIGCDDQAFGGGGLNLGIEALSGEADMITVFDDFNQRVVPDTFGSGTEWQAAGWIVTDLNTSSTSAISVNAGSDTLDWDSCIKVHPGVTDDSGGSLQLSNETASSAGQGDIFPHIEIPGSDAVPTGGGSAGTVLDNTTWTFACRIGLKADIDSTATDWDSSAFIGWVRNTDTSVMTTSDGVITIASAGPLVGFHILRDGSIRGISHRTAATAMTDGTNFTELVTTSGVDSTVANGARTAGDTMWFDLALRMEISDMSATSNGSTQFFYRGPTNATATTGGGRNQFDAPGQGYKPWTKHGTVLTDQTPNDDEPMVPTIEVINGPTAGRDAVFYCDWWAMGRSRIGT